MKQKKTEKSLWNITTGQTMKKSATCNQENTVKVI